MGASRNSQAVAALAFGLGLCVAAGAAGADEPPLPAGFAAAARQSYAEAQAAYQRAPTEVTAAWQLARACFDQAEFATNKTERASLAEQGIAVCQRALAHATNSAPLHYYLGMNLGQLARTRTLGAFKLVSQMEREFIQAGELDRQFDHAGPDRNLGLLYRDAPAFGSIGNRSKAREHLARAVQLAPRYPENRLNLVESCLKWGESREAGRELAALEAIWPAARTNLTGAAWAASWADWEPRRQRLKDRIKLPPEAAERPSRQR